MFFFTLSEINTRGNNDKLYKPRANTNLRKFSFKNRVVDLWNSLPSSVIGAPSIKTLEAQLDQFWNTNSVKFDIACATTISVTK